MDTGKPLDCWALMKYQTNSQQILLDDHLKIETIIAMLLLKDVIDWPMLISYHCLSFIGLL